MPESPNCDSCGYCGDDDVLAKCTCDPCDFNQPAGISVNIRATNSEGSDDWTVAR